MYNIIYADPPWQYKDKANSGKRGAVHKYDLMSIEDIKNLPVYKISADNSVLFMWATFPLLQESLNTFKAWEFDYTTCAFIWVKTNRKSHTDFMGMGNWTRSNGEICLMGTKGKNVRKSKAVRQVVAGPTELIRYPHTGHSVKPPIIRHRIVELLGDKPRVELFARDKAAGWDCWGNEIESNEHVSTILR